MPRLASLPPFRRLLVGTAWVGFGLSLAVHVASLFGVGLIDEFVFLHVGVVLLGIGAVLWRKDLRSFDWRSPLASQRASAKAIFAGAPPWARRAIQLGFLYVCVNMLALVLHGESGHPVSRGGRFVVEERGRVVRELTEAEYRSDVARASRMFSAFWALGYGLLVVLYSVPSSAPPGVERGRSDREA